MLNADNFVINKIKNHFEELEEKEDYNTLYDLMSAGNGFLDFYIRENTNKTLEEIFRGNYLGFAEFIEKTNSELPYSYIARYIAEDNYNHSMSSDNPLDLAEESYGGRIGYYEAYAIKYLMKDEIRKAFPKEFNESIDKHFGLSSKSK